MSKILDLTDYDIVFTTSYEVTHGLSGHLYEEIEYHYTALQNGLKSVLLLSDGTTTEMLKAAVTDKYTFTEKELEQFFDNVIECAVPKLIRANDICVVDGSAQFNDAPVYCNNVYLLRCSQTDFSKFTNAKNIKQVHLLQDFLVYDDRYENENIIVVDYVKKILWDKYKQPKDTITDTALFYLTTNCRGVSVESIQKIIDRQEHNSYTIITNNIDLYSPLEADNVSVINGPVKDIFDQFDTLIYTPTGKSFDCSPRFIVECEIFGKQVQYEIDYEDRGITARRNHIQDDINSLHLNTNDYFFRYVRIWNG